MKPKPTLPLIEFFDQHGPLTVHLPAADITAVLSNDPDDLEPVIREFIEKVLPFVPTNYLEPLIHACKVTLANREEDEEVGIPGVDQAQRFPLPYCGNPEHQ
ncbi:MAG TPA: hypothetical protein VEH04_11315 [Verrucomicrobiae bacterium]|nr:hypothetical protein [Verrucomicrobiae bacterium]